MKYYHQIHIYLDYGDKKHAFFFATVYKFKTLNNRT